MLTANRLPILSLGDITGSRIHFRAITTASGNNHRKCTQCRNFSMTNTMLNFILYFLVIIGNTQNTIGWTYFTHAQKIIDDQCAMHFIDIVFAEGKLSNIYCFQYSIAIAFSTALPDTCSISQLYVHHIFDTSHTLMYLFSILSGFRDIWEMCMYGYTNSDIFAILLSSWCMVTFSGWGLGVVYNPTTLQMGQHNKWQLFKHVVRETPSRWLHMCTDPTHPQILKSHAWLANIFDLMSPRQGKALSHVAPDLEF